MKQNNIQAQRTPYEINLRQHRRIVLPKLNNGWHKETRKWLFSSSFEAAANRYFIGKSHRRHSQWKINAYFSISGQVFHARISRVIFQHAQLACWEHVIMRKWRINREGIIAMEVLYELVTTISKRPSEREILQWSSLLLTASQRERYGV